MSEQPQYSLLRGQAKEKVYKTFQSLKRVFAYAKPFTKLIVVGNICMVLSSGLSILVPLQVGKVIDIVNNDRSGDGLVYLSKVIGIILIFSISLGIFKDYIFDILALNVVRSMRKDLFKSLMEKDIEFYDTRKSGDLLSRLTGDIETVQNASTSDLSNFIRRVVEMVGSFILLLTISVKLTLFCFIFIPFKIVVLAMAGKLRKKKSKEISDVNSEANAVASEAFQNIRVVKSFSSEGKECGHYVDKLDKVFELERKNLIQTSFLSFARAICGSASLVLMVWLGGSLVLSSNLSAGDLSSFLIYLLAISSGFNSIDRMVRRFAKSLGACENLFKILDYEPEIDITTKSMRSMEYDFESKKQNFQGNIRVDEVTFSYPTKPDVTVLNKVSINIKKGETVAIVGASGSGKSTIVSLLERFYDAQGGKVCFDDEDIKDYDLKWLHKQIGFVSQEPALFSCSVRDNIGYGSSGYTEEDLQRAIALANAAFIYDQKQFPEGLNTLVGERGIKLSGGQKQRIAIARALLTNPKILIFDEATSALDAESEHQVQMAIDQLVSKGDKTVIIIAHRLSTVKFCDRILVFQSGNIVEEGNHSSLLTKNGVYKSLIQRQLEGYSI